MEILFRKRDLPIPNISKNDTKINGISPMNVRILGRKLCAESVRSKKYDKHVEHSIAAGQYKNTSMPNVNRAGGCKRKFKNDEKEFYQLVELKLRL